MNCCLTHFIRNYSSWKNSLSVQCNTLHGTENIKITCGVCLSVCVRARRAHGFWGRMSGKRLKIELGFNRTPIKNRIWRIDWSRDLWSHVTLKGQGRDQISLGPIAKMAGDTDSVTIRAPVGNDTWAIKWLLDLWRHVTGKVRSCQIYLDGHILKSVSDSIGQTSCSLNIILFV